MIRNKLKHWRHRCEMNQKGFAAFLGLHPSTISRYENHEVEPDTPALYKMWQKLKTKFPDLHMEDLLE